MENNLNLPKLNEEQIRVLGVLIEKSKTTPEYYPMTINAITTACNQKTSRKPVVNYDEEIVVQTLNSLKIAGLVSTASGAGMRSVKYKHNVAIIYPLIPAELTILCLLFLRGALTPGEINTNSVRLFEFDNLEEIQVTLDKLSSEDYVLKLNKQAGQKEQRYIHLFGSETITENLSKAENEYIEEKIQLEERILKLEEELAVLKEKFDQLLKEWTE